MKKLVFLLFFSIVLIPLINADVIWPTETTVYFNYNGMPHDELVDFTIKCYGYTYTGGFEDPMLEPGTYDIELVFSSENSCDGYGCKIYEDYYLNYRHIDYCNLEGNTLGKSFIIEKYDVRPIKFMECDTDITVEEPGDISRLCEATFVIPDNVLEDDEPATLATRVQIPASASL